MGRFTKEFLTQALEADNSLPDKPKKKIENVGAYIKAKRDQMKLEHLEAETLAAVSNINDMIVQSVSRLKTLTKFKNTIPRTEFMMESKDSYKAADTLVHSKLEALLHFKLVLGKHETSLTDDRLVSNVVNQMVFTESGEVEYQDHQTVLNTLIEETDNVEDGIWNGIRILVNSYNKSCIDLYKTKVRNSKDYEYKENETQTLKSDFMTFRYPQVKKTNSTANARNQIDNLLLHTRHLNDARTVAEVKTILPNILEDMSNVTKLAFTDEQEANLVFNSISAELQPYCTVNQ